MKKRITALLSALLMGTVPFAAVSADSHAAENSPYRVVGYLPDWSYTAYESLDMNALTHLNIAFCNPDENGDLSCWIPKSRFEDIVTKAHECGTKVMAALGGGGGCDGYLPLLDTPEEMADFSEKIIAYCHTYDLDGIDLDIELAPSDPIWNYYGDWVAHLRDLCDVNGYELSTATAQWVAGGASEETFAKFDFINVMAYDNDLSRVSHAGMDFAESSLDYFSIKRNIPREKLVLGVPFYGRGYAADGTMDWNIYMSFKRIVEADPANYYADVYNGIAYNGADTMAEKCALAKDYGGIMIWELSQDAEGEYSLLSVIDRELNTIITGDVNGDGEFGTADLVTLGIYLMGTGGMKCPEAADLDSSGTIDSFDLVVMRQMIAEKYR